MPANHHIMSNLHKIINLGPFLDPSPTKTRPVDRRVRANLHVVVNLYNTRLGYLYVSTCHEFEAKTVTTDDRSTVDDDPVTNQTSGPQRDACRQLAIATDPRAMSDVTVGTNDRVRTDLRARFDHHKWLNGDILPQDNSWGDNGRRMNFASKLDWRRGEFFQ